MADENKIKNYMTTCAPGAEEILTDEIKEIMGAKSVYESVKFFPNARGRVFFRAPYDAGLSRGGGLGALSGIKCADNIYVIIRKFKTGPHKSDLAAIGAAVSSADFGRFFNFASGYDGKIRAVISAVRAGRHNYSRFEIADEAEAALLSTGLFTRGTIEDHGAAFRIDVFESDCLLSLQLTKPESKFRGSDVKTVPGGLRPSFARCLIRLSEPKGADVFYDPFCGAGTIANERAAFNYKKIFAGDISDDVLEKARENLVPGVILLKRDAAATNMKSESVDAVVSNMPWGKQVPVQDMDGLYDDFFKEMKRILKNGARAVLLTDQERSARASCEKYGLIITKTVPFSLHGLHPSAFVIRKE